MVVDEINVDQSHCVPIFERDKSSKTMVFNGSEMKLTPEKAAKFIVPVYNVTTEFLISIGKMVEKYKDRKDSMILVIRHEKLGFGIL